MPQPYPPIKAAIILAINVSYAAANAPAPKTATTTFGTDGQPKVVPGPPMPAALDAKLVDAIAEGVAAAIAPFLPTVPM